MHNSFQIRSLWPYAAALLGGAFTYLATLLWSQMHALAAAVAVIFGLTVYVCSRLIQSRGKLSLKVTIIILPLVTAIICVGLQQMYPYRLRQRTTSALGRAGMIVELDRPEVEGEWFRDKDSGIPLPYWLVRLCGEDAMSDVYHVSGALEAFQKIDIRRQHLPRLFQVDLVRDGTDPPLSVEMIENLSKLKLDHIELKLEGITDADMPGLKELNKLSGINYICVSAFTHKIETGVDLSVLPKNCWLKFSGRELTVQQATQIQHVKFWRELSVDTLTAEAVYALHSSTEDAGPLRIIGSTLDEAATRAITRYTGGSIVLVNCKFPDGFKMDLQPGRIRSLTLAGTTIPDEELIQWIKESKMSGFQTDQVLKPESVEPFKKIETLERLYYDQPDGKRIGVELRSPIPPGSSN
ncbi:MAG: hypothetical protein U0930_19180 [Pirellulales bacterium]